MMQNLRSPSAVSLFRLRTSVWLGLIGLLLFGSAGSSQQPDLMKLIPEMKRDENISSPEQFFGFAAGSRHLRHDQVTAYLRMLAEKSSRVAWIEYGQTQGGRPLYVLAISSVENIRRLPEIQVQRQALTSGQSVAEGESAKLIMFMGYGVHGDEASAMNAAPLVAYHLVSGQSADLDSLLEQAVLFIDPCLNPDGSDRFAQWVNENRGRFANANPADREHRQPWPGGRGNYYWFDLNRDWLPLAHPESQGRLRMFHHWKPHVVLDYHEMGPGSSYFFQPGVPARNNPLTPPGNLQLTREFAKSYASALDQAGELFFTEEVFDDFYIGKGSTYPDVNGAIGILFEQGSTRGLKIKTDTRERHFVDSIANQVRTSLVSLQRLLELKRELLDFQQQFFRDSRLAGQQQETTAYLLTGTTSRVMAARQLLEQHRIESYINLEPIRLKTGTFPKGQALIIPTAQTQWTLLESMMRTDQYFEENIFYDVSAWHLPSAFDLEVQQLTSDVPQQWLTSEPSRLNDEAEPFWGDLDLSQIVGFAFSPLELDSARWVTTLMQSDIEVRVSQVPFMTCGDSTIPELPMADQRTLPAGTFLVLNAGNRERWNQVLRQMNRLARQSSIEPVVLTSSRNPFGPDLGSGRISILPKTNPALIVGEGTSSTTAGALWHFLDHRLEQPATLLNADGLGSAKLDEFTCLILPSGNYGSWGRKEATLLTEYARGGGTIIAIGSAISWVNRNNVLSAPAEGTATPPIAFDGLEPASNPQATTAPAARSQRPAAAEADIRRETGPKTRLRFADARDAAALESIAGAFFMTEIDSTHPLGFGFPDEAVPVFRDSSTVFAIPVNPLQTVAEYQSVIAGYVSDRNRERLLGTPAVWAQNVGQGRVVMIADDPVFRGYVRSSERFLTNAILLGPILRIPAAPIPK
jgi:hypothetical protein